ncbi:hypothetical protein GCM10009718_24140 [Isoptericola halotolerans]
MSDERDDDIPQDPAGATTDPEGSTSPADPDLPTGLESGEGDDLRGGGSPSGAASATGAAPRPATWPGPGTGAVPRVVPQQVREGAPVSSGGWRALVRAMRPRANRSQLLAAVLCAALGFALVVQVQQSAQDPLSSARQDDLVRLLDEVTQRSERLAEQVAELSATRDELQSGSGQAQAAVDLAEERAGAEGILSGRLPAVGPGLEIVIRDRQGALEASALFNVLEELRNAGAEVVELNDVRLVTSTWFRDTDEGVVVDDQPLEPPYRWTVIGDPATLSPALEIPGGALATVRTAGAEATTFSHDEVEVTAVREPTEPQYATPRRPES